MYVGPRTWKGVLTHVAGCIDVFSLSSSFIPGCAITCCYRPNAAGLRAWLIVEPNTWLVAKTQLTQEPSHTTIVSINLTHTLLLLYLSSLPYLFSHNI
jgi:hypothetical protein